MADAPNLNRFVSLPGGTGYAGVRIDYLQPRDASAAQDVLAAAWDQAYVGTGIITPDKRREIVDPANETLVMGMAKRIQEARFEGPLRRTLYIGAFASGQMVGVLKMKPYTPQTRLGRVWHALRHPKNIGYIDEIDVHPNHQHIGVGRALAAAALEHAQAVGYKHMRLDVVQSNARAINFYTKHLRMHMTRARSLPPKLQDAPGFMRVEMRTKTSKARARLLQRNPWLCST